MRTETGIIGGAPTPITEATGRGRRDIDDTLNAADAQTFRQAAGTGLYMSIDRPSLQFVMSVVMSGMSEPKVAHQLQVVRVARYVLQHSGEAWLCGCQADPKTLYVYTDMDWAADELTRKLVSCTVERYGSHMLDCSVAKQSLVALSSGETEFYCIVRAVATSKQTSQILEQIWMQSEVTFASDSSAAREYAPSGKVRHLSIKELWIQESYRKKEFQLVSVDMLLKWADNGTKAHTSELTSLLRQILRLEEGQKQALACLVKSNENSGRGHGGDGEDCDAWFDPEECDGCHGEDRDGVTPNRERRTLLATRNDAVPQRWSIELLQQSRQMWNGLFASAIVT